MKPESISEVVQRLQGEVGKAVFGQSYTLNALTLSLFCQGHCLLIGVPGLAKTLLVRSIAQALGMEFGRIQFTPDLMPSDILGSEILREHQGNVEFEFQLGPVFTNLLLADEINRTPPKTQSALLEAMQERHVTVARQTRALPDPFLVVATQNPIEHEGTYPLPEAQLDRFMFSIQVGYPSKAEEVEIVRHTTRDEPPELKPVVSREELLAIHSLVRATPVADHVLNYAVDLAAATRPGEPGAGIVAEKYIEWGAGPRASQYLVLGAKALALMSGLYAPETRHVRQVASFVLIHRIVPNYRATGEGLTAAQLVDRVLKETPEQSYSD